MVHTRAMFIARVGRHIGSHEFDGAYAAAACEGNARRSHRGHHQFGCEVTTVFGIDFDGRSQITRRVQEKLTQGTLFNP
jgi:hypothetical protein